jgi:hypothetical protein
MNFNLGAFKYKVVPFNKIFSMSCLTCQFDFWPFMLAITFSGYLQMDNINSLLISVLWELSNNINKFWFQKSLPLAFMA